MLARYDEETETDCADGARRLGLLGRNKRQRDLFGAQAELRPAAEGISEHADSHVGPGCGTARGADGQFRSGPSEHRRGPHRANGHHARGPTDYERRIRATAAAAAGDGARARSATAPDG